MSTQQNINNIAKLGYWLDIIIDEQGLITAGVYTKPKGPSGMSESILDPVNEVGNDLSDVLEILLRRLNKQMKKESKS